MLICRPLPPVRVPEKVTDGAGVGTSDRSVTGMVDTDVKAGPAASVSTTDPDWSPGVAGVGTVRVIDFETPGARVRLDVESWPKEAQAAVVAPNRTGPTVPP